MYQILMIINKSFLRPGLFLLNNKTPHTASKRNTIIMRNFFSNDLPKGSNFSNFMGLYKQLQTVRKQEMKQQKSKITMNTSIIILSLLVLGGYFFISFNDKNYKTWLQLSRIKLKSKIQTSSKRRPQVIRQGLTKIKNFLIVNPYDYDVVLNHLNYYAELLRKTREPQLVSLINDCYVMIVKHNFKAQTNVRLIEGITNVLEIFVLIKNKASLELIKVLLCNGSIQQTYLALRSLQRIQNQALKYVDDQGIKERIRQNMMTKYKKDIQYYNQVFKSQDDGQFPTIQFKRNEERRWLSYIQNKLNISFQ